MDNPWYLLRDTLIFVVDALIILAGHKLFKWGRGVLKIKKNDPVAYWAGEILGLTILIGGSAYCFLYFIVFHWHQIRSIFIH